MTDHLTVPEVPDVLGTDVFITRAFAAPRAVVWKFFTEPEYLARWFGPAEVHVDPASVAVNLHAGGSWDLDMVDNATGEHYPFRTQLMVVIPPEYLEGVASASTGLGPLDDISLRIWFHDHGKTTRMTLHQGPFKPEFRCATGAGWDASFLKIDALLAEGAE